MRQLFRYRFVVGAILALAVVPAFGQLSVDARGPVRERKWEVAGGQGGGTGRRLALAVAVRQLDGKRSTEARKPDVAFVLTNNGNEPITLPTSPHPGDFEPNDQNTGFEVETLALGIGLRADPRTAVISTILNGSSERSGSLATLAPGESMEVIVSAKLPTAPSAALSTSPFQASAILSHEVIQVKHGKRISNLEERGSAWSRPFALELPESSRPTP